MLWYFLHLALEAKTVLCTILLHYYYYTVYILLYYYTILYYTTLHVMYTEALVSSCCVITVVCTVDYTPLYCEMAFLLNQHFYFRDTLVASNRLIVDVVVIVILLTITELKPKFESRTNLK